MSQETTVHIDIRPAYGPLRHTNFPSRQPLFVGVEGPRGSGKTGGILTELVNRSLEFPGSRTILARKNREDLTETVLQCFEDLVLPMFSLKVPGNQSREGRTLYDMPNGSQFIPLAISEVIKTQSFEATWAYVNEAADPGLTKRHITNLAGCLRYLKTPKRPTLPKWSQLIFDVNPVDPNHWSNKWMTDIDDSLRKVRTFEDYTRLAKYNWQRETPKGRAKRIVTKHMDNPGYWDWAKWAYTDLGRAYVEEVLGEQTGFMRDRWLDGLWRAAEGSVFADAFTEEKNTCKPFQIPPDWPVWCYGDPGEDHPWAINWFTIGPTGRRFCIGEVSGRKLGGVSVVASLIKAKEKQMGVMPAGRYLDPRHGFASTAQSTATIAQQLDAEGLPGWMPAPRFQGKGYYASVEATRTQFKTGNFLIFTDCVQTIANHQSWSYARSSDGSVKQGDDAYEKINDDHCDTCRWFISGRHGRGADVPDQSQDDQALARYIAEQTPENSYTREF